MLAIASSMLYIDCMTEIKLPNLPKFELPFDLPKIDLPDFELPKFDLPTIDFELPTQQQVVAFVRDVAYAGTGLVALTAERIAELQAQLVELLKTVVSEGVARVERVRSAA